MLFCAGPGDCGRPWRPLLVLAMAGVALADPVWYNSTTQFGVKPNIPDFYQSQFAGADPDPDPLKPGYTGGNWWQKTGGWCGPTAFVDCMYYWGKNGYAGLYPTGGQDWLQNMRYAIEDAAIDMKYNTANRDYNGGLEKYIKDLNYGPEQPYGKNLVHTRYQYDEGTKKVQVNVGGVWKDTAYASMFDLYKKQLLDCQDVFMTLLSPDGKLQHEVTGAGLDGANKKLLAADPSDTRYGRAYTAADPFPVPQNASEYALYYDTLQIKADGRTIDGGDYGGWSIQWLHTVCPCVPLPSPFWSGLALLALLSLLWRSRSPSS